jgi:uncharacterized protein YjbI with pentapeptide repeats
LQGVSLAAGRFESCQFTRARCVQARASKSSWTSCVFEAAVCTAGSWVQARFTFCDFSWADLSGSDFGQSVWQTCDRHAVTDQATIWTGSKDKQVMGTDQPLKAAQTWVSPI